MELDDMETPVIHHNDIKIKWVRLNILKSRQRGLNSVKQCKVTDQFTIFWSKTTYKKLDEVVTESS